MGARYLLIEFDDEAAASRLREQIDNATRKGKRFRVVGLFAKPTNYCKCDPRKQVSNRYWRSPVKRGRKFGWAVCTDCGRPTNTLSSLVNLIKPSQIIEPPLFDVPMNWQGGPGFTARHHIGALSGTTLDINNTFYEDR